MSYTSFLQSLKTSADHRIETLLNEIEDSRLGEKGYQLSAEKHPVLYNALETIVGTHSGTLSPQDEEEYMHRWSDAYDRLQDDVLKEAGARWYKWRKNQIQ